MNDKKTKLSQKSKINFTVLEPITINQKDVSNWLLLYCAEKTVRKLNTENKKSKRKQLNDYKKVIMPNFKYSTDFKKISTQWWIDEIKWYQKQSKNFTHETLLNALLYRLQSVFFRNHSNCCFYKETKKGRKLDNKEFVFENQKLFRKFLNQSIKIISSKREFKPIIDLLPSLKSVKKVDIPEKVFSATYKLLGKDWNIAKNVVVGASTGVVTSIFLGPVIGGYIGNLTGFSGAAATSYGLAFLGAGSLASGGFGMIGGSVVLGLGFGITNGVRGGVKGASIDELHLGQAIKFLPLSLAIGRLQFENGDKKIPKLIYKTVSKRLKEFEKRLKVLQKKYDKLTDSFDDEVQIKNIEKLVKTVKQSVKLYKTAKCMSLSYDWLSGYDIYKEIKVG